MNRQFIERETLSQNMEEKISNLTDSRKYKLKQQYVISYLQDWQK